MATFLEVGEQVSVNVSRIEGVENKPGAFYPTRVLQKEDRSIRVQLPNGELSSWISAKYAHRKVGLIIIQIGDYDNEATNLDPLAKGILQNARILYGDDALVKHWKVRSKSELRHLFSGSYFGFADKIALVGHGSSDGILTIGSKTLPASKLGEIVAHAENAPDSGWQFLCATCSSGRAAFGKTLSGFRNVDCVIGPRHSAHSSEMAQFLQSFLNWNLLAGYTTTVAARYAKYASTGTGTFTMWRHGSRTPIS